MDRRRIAIVGAGCLLVVGAVTGLLLAYPFSTVTHDPYESEFDTSALPSDDDSFAIDETIRIYEDGDFALELETGFAVDGEHVSLETEWDVADETTRTVRYTDLDGEWDATRSWTDSADTYEGWLEHAGENETIEPVDDGYVSLDTSTDPSSIEDQFESTWFVGTDPLLSQLSFERVDETAIGDRSVDVFEPETGWYERVVSGTTVDEYRVTDAEGAVYADAETGALVSVEVTFSVVDASNYAAYVYERLDGGDSYTAELSYAVTDEATVERPAWADEPAADGEKG
ncbi:hypothetical protein [Halovivax gelatinilyticus]|uniref:hypothetical protein n=1 Tax=Halovivax gelatinilyticus TaxID=2961597 RepID=UPI0020CA3399|nr:hypothetical protein [Halovivax gelatinilyticus]